MKMRMIISYDEKDNNDKTFSAGSICAIVLVSSSLTLSDKKIVFNVNNSFSFFSLFKLIYIERLANQIKPKI